MNTESMRIGRRELLLAGFYALVLVWVNAYICRELFYVQTAYMNSMHGFWIALAKRAGGSWFHSEWWPYWDAGIPFEFTYPPLVPGLTAAWAAVQAIPEALALQRVTGVIYCLAPLTLFTAAWLLTRLPGCSFAAALFYSLTAPTQILVPDQNFSLKSFWDARRLFVVTVWDDTPHLAAIALLPLVILFLSLSIRRRRFGYYWAASALIALAALANAFGPVMTAIAAVCLLFVVRAKALMAKALRPYHPDRRACAGGQRAILCPLVDHGDARRIEEPFRARMDPRFHNSARDRGFGLDDPLAFPSALDRGLEIAVFRAVRALDLQRADHRRLSSSSVPASAQPLQA